MRQDITTEPLGTGSDGQPVYLRDIWPSNKEIDELVASSVTRPQFLERYAVVTQGTKEWQALKVETGSETYRWNDGSTYVKNPPYFEGMTMEPAARGDILGARVLGLFGDNITTDHISPAGSIKKTSPAGDYLGQHQIMQKDFNSYGSRRGNHEVMMRGTFYKAEDVPLVVFGGKEYGMGSSRDWAAKGTMLLGIKAVIAESFERIHRSNLVGMGVLPLLFQEGVTRHTLGLKGDETIDIVGLENLQPRMDLTMRIHRGGATQDLKLVCRVDTLDEVNYYNHGGILQYVLRGMAKAA
jgi:aconitate hydratase